MLQVYYPQPGKSNTLPKMFEHANLEVKYFSLLKNSLVLVLKINFSNRNALKKKDI